MFIYYLVVIFSLFLGYVYQKNPKIQVFILNLSIFILFLVFGFRTEVGVDWYSYLLVYERQVTSDTFFDTFEIGYKTINVLGGLTGLNIVFVVASCTFLMLFFTFWGARKLDINPFYFFAIVAPYHFVMSGMNFYRQSIALSVFIFSISYLYAGDRKKGVVFAILGSFFHVSLLSMIPLFFIDIKKRYLALLSLLSSPVVLWLMYLEFGHYIDSTMDNSGFYLRALFILVCSFLMLISIKYFKRSSILTIRLSILVMCSFPLLVIVSLFSSTIADRFSYYLILLSTIVWFKMRASGNGNYRYFGSYVSGMLCIASITAFSVWCYFSKYIDQYSFKHLLF